jgi:hypothetical protein
VAHVDDPRIRPRPCGREVPTAFSRRDVVVRDPRVAMVAAVQPFLKGGISATVNTAEHATSTMSRTCS